MTEPDPHPIYTALEHELKASGPDAVGEPGSATEPADDPDQS